MRTTHSPGPRHVLTHGLDRPHPLVVLVVLVAVGLLNSSLASARQVVEEASQPSAASNNGLDATHGALAGEQPTSVADSVTFTLEVRVSDAMSQPVRGLVVDFYRLVEHEWESRLPDSQSSAATSPYFGRATKEHLAIAATDVNGRARLELPAGELFGHGSTSVAPTQEISESFQSATIYYEVQPAITDVSVGDMFDALPGKAGFDGILDEHVFTRPNPNFVPPPAFHQSWGEILVDHGFASRHAVADHRLDEAEDHKGDLNELLSRLSDAGLHDAADRLVALTAGDGGGPATVTLFEPGRRPSKLTALQIEQRFVQSSGSGLPYYPPCRTQRHHDDVFGYARFDANNNGLSENNDPGAASVVVTFEYRGAPGYSNFRSSCRTTSQGLYVFDTPPMGTSQHRLKYQVRSPRAIRPALGVIIAPGGLAGTANLSMMAGSGVRQDVLLFASESSGLPGGTQLTTADPDDEVQEVVEPGWTYVFVADVNVIPETYGFLNLGSSMTFELDGVFEGNIKVFGAGIGAELMAGRSEELGSSVTSRVYSDGIPRSIYVAFPSTGRCHALEGGLRCLAWRFGRKAEEQLLPLAPLERRRTMQWVERPAGETTSTVPGQIHEPQTLWPNGGTPEKTWSRQSDHHVTWEVFLTVGRDVGIPGTPLEADLMLDKLGPGGVFERASSASITYGWSNPQALYSEVFVYNVAGNAAKGLVYARDDFDRPAPFLGGDSLDTGQAYCRLPNFKASSATPILGMLSPYLPSQLGRLEIRMKRNFYVERGATETRVLQNGGSRCEAINEVSGGLFPWLGATRHLQFNYKDQYGMNHPTTFIGPQEQEDGLYDPGYEGFLVRSTVVPGTLLRQFDLGWYARNLAHRRTIENIKGASMAVGSTDAFGVPNPASNEMYNANTSLGYQADCTLTTERNSPVAVTLDDPFRWVNVIAECEAKGLWTADPARFLSAMEYNEGAQVKAFWCANADTPGCSGSTGQ